MDFGELLLLLAENNIKLFYEDAKLRVNAPDGVLDNELRSLLRAHKENFTKYFEDKEKRPKTLSNTTGAHRELIQIKEIPKNKDIPLTLSQQRLWFIDQLLGESSHVYHTSEVLSMKGKVNVSSIEKALLSIVKRHDSLRMTFTEKDGVAVTKLIKPYIPSEIVNISQLKKDERESKLQELILHNSNYPFSLKEGPLLNSIIVKLSDEEHVLLISMHHIISDGWSIGVFVKELAEFYQAYESGIRPKLPILPFQYQDYAYSQREWFTNERVQNQLNYWKSQLEGVPELLELSPNRKRPAKQTHKGAVITQDISSTLLSQLNLFGKQKNTTLFMVLLSIFNVLLYRHSGKNDFCIGTPIANRNDTDIEKLIGYFINLLVLRSKQNNKTSFLNILHDTRDTCLDAYSHPDLPFDELIEVMGSQRSLSYSPLFQVMFILQNAPLEEVSLLGIDFKLLDEEGDTAHFDLLVDASESDEGLFLVWQYNTDIYDEWRIRRMSEHFELLLKALLDKPEQSIGQFPLLTKSEQHELALWNNTSVVYPKEKMMIDLFMEQVKISPDDIAVVCANGQLSYRELDERSNQLASHLLEQYVIEGEYNPVIAICVERSLELIIGLLGILKAGGAYVPLDPDYPQRRLEYMLEDSGAKLLLTQQDFAEKLRDYEGKSISLDSDWKTILRQSKNPVKVSVTPNDLAYMIYTSGSTGRPKGVMIQHNSLANFITNAIDIYQIEPKDSVLQFSTISFDTSVEEIFPAICVGSKLVIRSNEDLIVDNLLETIRKHNITIIDLPTAYWSQFLNEVISKEESLPQVLRMVIVGGEEIHWQDIGLWNKQVNFPSLINTYGPTECTVVALTYRINQQSSNDVSVIGKPISNTQIYILDEGNQHTPVGVAGELCISGVCLARGYLNRPELTAEKFIYLGIHPETLESCPEEAIGSREGFVRTRLYRTGDLGRWLPDGNIEYLGRTDSQVKLRGFRIELGEIENRLLEHPSIREVVAGVSGENENKLLIAWIVINGGTPEPNAEELRPWLKARLPDYMVPSFYVPLESLPLTPNGKIDRKALPTPDSSLFTEAYVAPETETEKSLATLWEGLLKQEQVGRTDNFFERGGHSLIATQLVSRIRDVFEVELPLQRIFEFPELGEMALSIDSSQRAVILPAITPIPEGEAIPLSFAQQRLWFIDQLMGGESTVYNMPIALRLRGEVNLDALHEALIGLVNRHDSLRMRFTSKGNIEKVELLPAYDPLEQEDISDISEDKQELRVKVETENYLEKAFNLERGPLFKAKLLVLGEKRYVLIANIHHIISDGWSVGVLVRDLIRLYQSYDLGVSSTLTKLSTQYQDYAYWQRQWLDRDELQNQLDYWKEKLQGIPQLLELPTERPRPAQQSYEGARLTSHIPLPTLDGLNQLGKEYGTTLFMTLLAAFYILLNRYSNQDDICVGSPIANRNHSGTEDQVGFFANTLVLRAQLEGIETFEELLVQTKATCLEAYENQDVPFEMLVERLHASRNPAVNPLFQVMFVLDNAPMEGMDLPNMQFSIIKDKGTVARFDLTVSAIETDHGLSLNWEYNTDLFDKWLLNDMSEVFCQILEDICNEN